MYNNLTWKPHIEYLCKKLSAANYLLIKLRHYVDLKTLIAVYNSIVYSYIQYSIINWGRAYSTALQPLHILHKKILRIMNFSDFTTPSTPLFFKCNILKIPDIYTLELAKLIHNFLSKKILILSQIFSYCQMKFTIILQDHLYQKIYFCHG